MASGKRKALFCTFAGGCGQVFSNHSDLLDHITQHLGEEQSIENKGNNHGGGVRGLSFSGLENFEVNDALHPSLPLPTTPSRDLDIGLENSELFPELNVMMNRYQLEEEALSPSNAINMDQILQPLDPCLDLVSSAPLPVLDQVNWSELLENHPSVTDTMDYEDIVDASLLKEEEEANRTGTSFSSVFGPSSSSISNSSQCSADLEDDSHDEGEASRSTGGKDLDRIWLPVSQGKPLNFTQKHSRHSPNLKYKHGQASTETGISESGKERFRQEVVTFVTKEKRAYKAILTTPRSKPKQVNRKANQQNNQDIKYYSSEFILREGLKKKRGMTHSLNKPYICPVPGCGKAYKNPNGIKYHARYGHSAPQEFPCQCGKIYSTRHGLMAHKRTHSLSSSPGSMDDFYSFSEAESEEYRHHNNTDLI